MAKKALVCIRDYTGDSPAKSRVMFVLREPVGEAGVLVGFMPTASAEELVEFFKGLKFAVERERLPYPLGREPSFDFSDGGRADSGPGTGGRRGKKKDRQDADGR